MLGFSLLGSTNTTLTIDQRYGVVVVFGGGVVRGLHVGVEILSSVGIE